VPWDGPEAVETAIARPRVIDDVLVSPGIGFMTFQRFNGDALNEGLGWTEGYPIEYQPFGGSLETPGHPLTSLAYFRVYWKFVEPSPGEYDWEMLDRALASLSQKASRPGEGREPHLSLRGNHVPIGTEVIPATHGRP